MSNDNTKVEVKQNSILMPLIVGVGSIALIGLVVFLLWRRKKHNT
ncbi:MAG: LPXTG cell wall anchor domain-containing protein [Clostridia bacterium]|nr:LPXTG cell wall anchor domain-containing protein [Clostridia bacterium]